MTDTDCNADHEPRDDYDEIRAGIEAHDRRVREALAEDLGGEPKDYDSRATGDGEETADSSTA